MKNRTAILSFSLLLVLLILPGPALADTFAFGSGTMPLDAGHIWPSFHWRRKHSASESGNSPARKKDLRPRKELNGNVKSPD